MARSSVRLLCVVLLSALCGAASSSITSAARVLVLNQGEEPIYALARSADGTTWTADLLGMTGVVRLGEGRWTRVPLDPATCYYDIRATYPDGHTSIAPHVDLCAVDRVVFRH